MRRPSSRGFTLIEMMVTVVIGSIVVLGAVAVAGHMIRVLGRSSQTTDLQQVGRATLDMIIDDLTNAGVGVGYRLADDQFEGLVDVSAGTGAAFEWAGRPVGGSGTFVDGGIKTQDLAIRVADGATATVLQATAGKIQVCGPAPGEPGFVTTGEEVVARDAFGLAARTLTVTAVSPGTCPSATTCAGSGSCVDLSVAEQPAPWASDADAADPAVTPLESFLGGSLTGGYREVIWYVEGNNNPTGLLRRGILSQGCGIDEGKNAAGDSASCGEVAAVGVESLRYEVLQWDGAAWSNKGLPVDNRSALRVELELVVRARSADDLPIHDPVELRIDGSGNCYPSPCNQKTTIRREVFRASVEIKNSGHMRLSGS